MYWPNVKSVASPLAEIIAIDVLGGGCEPPSWGRGGHRVTRGSGMRDGTVRTSTCW